MKTEVKKVLDKEKSYRKSSLPEPDRFSARNDTKKPIVPQANGRKQELNSNRTTVFKDLPRWRPLEERPGTEPQLRRSSITVTGPGLFYLSSECASCKYLST